MSIPASRNDRPHLRDAPHRRAPRAGLFLAIAFGLVLGLASEAARAGERTFPAIESRLYFGMSSADGTGVSEQAFADFLANEITPRFPDGLTLISVYGQSAGATPPTVIQERTKLLIVVHPDTEEAAAKTAEIKRLYTERFDQNSVFHTRAPVEIVLEAEGGE